MSDVSIVIVTYRCREAVEECIDSVVTMPPAAQYEVVVLENASDDGTAEMIESRFPDVRLLRSEVNVGFAAGVNRAAESATGDWLLLLNPDTVVHPGSVDALLRFARENPSYGLYGGRTVNPDGSVHPGSCWGKPTLWSLFCFATMLSTGFRRSRVFDPESLGRWERDTVREVDIVTGCLLLVRRQLWQQLSGFDERFFMYGEDADLALRVAALGLRNVITPDAVVTHQIGVSSASRPDKLVLLLTGKATLLRKHWSGWRRALGVRLLWAGVGLRAVVGALFGIGSGRRASGWVPVWNARESWLRGYAPKHRDPQSKASSPPE